MRRPKPTRHIDIDFAVRRQHTVSTGHSSGLYATSMAPVSDRSSELSFLVAHNYDMNMNMNAVSALLPCARTLVGFS